MGIDTDCAGIREEDNSCNALAIEVINYYQYTGARKKNTSEIPYQLERFSNY